MFLAGMGERESIASELSETVFFSDLRNVKMSPYSRIEKNGESSYVVPFNRGRSLLGFARVETPKRIVFHYKDGGKYKEQKFKSLHEAKSFIVRTFVK